jgi:hypothetical protein
MPGTIEQREQAARELREKNKKDIFELPEELSTMGKPIMIFNIGPFRHQRSMGSYGQWTIHPCEAGQVYSKPTEVPYITNDPIHLDMFQMAHRHDSGRKLAADILGLGQFHTASESLEKWGVFIAAGTEPTEEELKAARMRLNRTWDALIMEADSYWNQGPGEYKNVTDMHRMAAKARGQMNKPWARGVVEMMKCHICASQVDPAAAICPHCKTVINEAKVIQARVPGYEYLWADQTAEVDFSGESQPPTKEQKKK